MYFTSRFTDSSPGPLPHRSAPDEDTGDPEMEANLLVHGLSEAASLLHAVAGGGGEGMPG